MNNEKDTVKVSGQGHSRPPLMNHAGLCEVCKLKADELAAGNQYIQRRIGHFAEVNKHIQAHYEIMRLWKIKRGYIASLPAFLRDEEG
jgi:hypothetical protein